MEITSKPGYEYLLTYKLSVEIERLTDEFCQVYLDLFKDRRYIEQMNSSARSMVRNIVEGHIRLGLKDYIEFLSFSRASGEELLKDYQRLAEKWGMEIKREKREKGNKRVIGDVPPLNPLYPLPPLNFLINLVIRTNYLLDRQIASLEQKFILEGGYSENLARRRRNFRGY